MAHDHGGGTSTVPDTLPRIALVGAPNAGKTSIFNGLTGVHAKTGNYPGVTVSRSVGTLQAGDSRRKNQTTAAMTTSTPTMSRWVGK